MKLTRKKFIENPGTYLKRRCLIYYSREKADAQFEIFS